MSLLCDSSEFVRTVFFWSGLKGWNNTRYIRQFGQVDNPRSHTSGLAKYVDKNGYEAGKLSTRYRKYVCANSIIIIKYHRQNATET